MKYFIEILVQYIVWWTSKYKENVSEYMQCIWFHVFQPLVDSQLQKILI